jgi:ACR3 family arsenite transporter
VNDTATPAKAAPDAPKRLNIFERWLSIWVALCMVVGIALGKLFPGLTDALRRIEFGDDS